MKKITKIKFIISIIAILMIIICLTLAILLSMQKNYYEAIEMENQLKINMIYDKNLITLPYNNCKLKCIDMFLNLDLVIIVINLIIGLFVSLTEIFKNEEE